jgi:hypothetical protein
MNATGPLWAAAPLTEQTCSKIGTDEVLRRKWSACAVELRETWAQRPQANALPGAETGQCPHQ